MKLRNLMVVAAATGLVAMPVVAQAGTVAGNAKIAKLNLSDAGSRRSAPVKSKQKFDAALGLVALIGAGAGGYGIYKAVDNKDDDVVSNGAS